jgi:hypothetical protein
MDPDLSRGYPIPDKDAALVLLFNLLGREPYVPPERTRPRAGEATAPDAPEMAAEADVPPRRVSVSEQVARRLRKSRRPRVGL